MATDPKAIAVAMAIKQSLEMNAGAGSAINAHPNAFFLNVTGAIDLYKAAEAALARATQFEENKRVQFEHQIGELAKKITAEITNGAAGVEDAIARLVTKGGGELTVGTGVLEEATARIRAALARKVSG